MCIVSRMVAVLIMNRRMIITAVKVVVILCVYTTQVYWSCVCTLIGPAEKIL